MSNTGMISVGHTTPRHCQDAYRSPSTGTKLHYCNHPVPDSGNADDLGFLWFVNCSWIAGVLLTLSDYMNRNGSNLGSKVLMIVVAILNAGRNSFSFFLLLIVCMGYGVVKHTLGKTMIYVRYLAGAHFVFGLIYSIASLTVTPENAGESCESV